jgi:adenosylhomocysteine nucleosidase
MAIVMTEPTNESKPADCRPWAFLFALEREARPFTQRVANTGDRTIIRVTGIGAHRAAIVTARVIDEFSPAAVIACGFAGALRPTLKVGDLVAAREVVDGLDRVWPCSAITGSQRVLTAKRIIGEPADKADMFAKFDADAVDMESAAIAKVCCERGIAFGCVRVISDTAATRLSPRIMCLLSSGDVSWLGAALALVKSPLLFLEMTRLARDTKFAADRLAEALATQSAGKSSR